MGPFFELLQYLISLVRLIVTHGPLRIIVLASAVACVVVLSEIYRHSEWAKRKR